MTAPTVTGILVLQVSTTDLAVDLLGWGGMLEVSCSALALLDACRAAVIIAKISLQDQDSS